MPALLKDLNSNIETPTLLWNQACRNEILKFIEVRLQSSKNSSSASSSSSDDIESTQLDAQHFRYQTLERELLIGNIYVRIYNEQIRAQVALPNPKGFCTQLAEYIHANAPGLGIAHLRPKKLLELRRRREDGTMDTSDAAAEDEESEYAQLLRLENSLTRIRMAAEAMRNVLQTAPGTDLLINKKAAYIEGIFDVFAIMADPPAQAFAIEVVERLTRNSDCIKAIADAHVLGRYVSVLLAVNVALAEKAVGALSSMLGASKIVADCLAHGIVLYLIAILATPTERGAEITPRTAALAALAKMAADPVHGARVQIAVARFLPRAIMGTAKQDPEAAVHMFDATHENPELIWTNSTREQLRSTTEKMVRELYARQVADPDAKWDLPDDYRLVYEEMEDQIEIGGVYLNIFLKQPSWALQDPKAFLEAMLTRFVDLYSQAARGEVKENPLGMMDTIVTATNALLSGTPELCAHAAKTGHLVKILSLMASEDLPPQYPAAPLIAILATNQLCVETMAQTPSSVCAVARVMTASPEKSVPPGVEALDKAFAKAPCTSENCLVKQLLDTEGALPLLLSILDGKLDMKLATKANEVRARTVSALQKALEDPFHGSRLRIVLEKSPIWSNYSGMRHDLFLPGSQNVTGLLTNGSAAATAAGAGGGGSVGLLTNAPHSAQIFSDLPPEI